MLNLIRNQQGMAILETVPLLVIFVVLLSFAMGLWGAVHTATLHSVAARTYSFEAYRQRVSLYYHREDGTGTSASSAINFTKKGWRFQAVQHETDDARKFVSTQRPISLGNGVQMTNASDVNTHNTSIYSILTRNDRTSVNPMWVMVGYGICLRATCGN